MVKLLSEKSWLSDSEVCTSLIALIKITSKNTEANKAYFVTNGGLKVLMDAVEAHGDDAKVLGKVCMTVGVLCKFDDFRKEMSR